MKKEIKTKIVKKTDILAWHNNSITAYLSGDV